VTSKIKERIYGTAAHLDITERTINRIHIREVNRSLHKGRSLLVVEARVLYVMLKKFFFK